MIARRMLFIRVSALAGWALLATLHLRAEETPMAWPGVKYVKVVAYRFKDPATPPSGSLLKDGVVNQTMLKSRTVKSATLSVEQSARLLKAISASDKHLPGASCYTPHHIFLFLDEGGKVVAAFEVCFHCGNEALAPETNPLKVADFRKVAKICEDCGIGLDDEGGTAETYAKEQDDIERRRDSPKKASGKEAE